MNITNITEIKPVVEHENTATLWYHFDQDELKQRTRGGWLHFVAEVTVERGVVLDPHSHADFDEFYYILTGRGIMRVGSEEREVAQGDMIRIPATQVHSIRPKGDSAPVHFLVMAVKLGEGKG